MITNVCQRWHAGRSSYRPAGEVFDPRGFEIEASADDAAVKAYVVGAHYSHSYPAARRRFTLRARGGSIVGAAVFSAPMHRDVLRPWGMDDALELGRLVLDDAVPANAESYFVARCFEALRAEGFAGVVSFSDPEPRTTAGGERVFVGHVGTVYQALNAIYTGRATPRSLHVLPDGTIFSARAASKVRGRERGWEYAVEQLVAHGAERPADGADLSAWLRTTLARLARVMRHQGNHRYAWGLTRGARLDLRAHSVALTYPKFTLRVCSMLRANDVCTAAGDVCSRAA